MTKVLAAAAAAGLTLALVPPSMAAGRQAATSQSCAPRSPGSRSPCAPGASTTGRSTRSTGPARARRCARSSSGPACRSTASRAGRTRAALGPLGRPLRARRVLAARRVRLGRVRAPVRAHARGRLPLADRRLLRRRDDACAARATSRRTGLVADGVAGPRDALAASAASRPRRRASRGRRPRRYVVRPGDSLTAIADRFGTTLPALARANRLDPSRVLLIGTKLRCPPSAATATDDVADRGAEPRRHLGRAATASIRRSPARSRGWSRATRRISPRTRAPGA